MEAETRILIVDDDESISRTMELIFEAKNYATKIALSGQEAIAATKERDYNLAILDIRLPDVDGITLLGQLSKMNPDLGIILITGYASMETAVDALNKGAAAYITKPLNMDEVLITVSQVLERQQLKEKLRESEQRNRIIVDAMSDLVLVYDSEGRYSDYFAQDESMLVRPWNEMKGKRIEEIVPQDIATIHYENAKKIRETGENITIDFELEIGGALRWLRGTMMLHEDGESIVAALKDITEGKHAEENLRLSEERHRMVLSSMSDMIFVLDKNNNYIEFYASDQFAPFSAPEDFLGKNVKDILPSDVTQKITECINHVRETRNREEIEYSLILDNAKAWYSAVQDIHKDGESIVQTVRNITEQKKAQEETKQAADTALLYLDIMSHDVRNQLQAIIMASEILEHMELDVESILALEIITESVEKSQKLINKVLATKELLSMPLSVIPLKRAIDNLLMTLKVDFDDVIVNTQFRVENPLVQADKFIEQLFMNILENAIEHCERKMREVWIELQDREKGYQISIMDNGPGIPDGKKESLFDPRRRFGGIGIHQSIRILKKYGGRMSVHDRVESDLSQGTEFRIWLPKAS